MDGDSLSPLIVIFIILILLGAVFAAVETCISAMNRLKIKSLADDGDRRAKKALAVQNAFDSAITTLLILINITHISAGSVATLIAIRLFGDGAGVATATTFIATGIVFLFSEMIPKAFANDRADSLCLKTSGFMLFLMKIFKPLSVFFVMISGFVTRLFSKSDVPSFTEDELYDIIETAEEEGVVDEEQSDLIKSALDFPRREVGDVMTMRNDVFAVDVNTPLDELVKMLVKSNHSRIPVYSGTLDNVVGGLNIRTFFREYRKNENLDIKTLLMPIKTVEKTMPVDDLLREMQKTKQYAVIVCDGEDKTPEGRDVIVGLATVEDLTEELVGEIFDEDDRVDERFIRMGGNYFDADPTLAVGNAFGRFGVVCRNKADARKTLLALTLENIENPEEEDCFVYGENVLFTVDKMDGGEIKRIVLHLLDEDEIEEMKKTEENGKEAAE